MPKEDAGSKSPNALMLSLQGLATAGSCAATLAGIGFYLNLQRYVLIAGGIQLAVALGHGLPYRSEKFFDLSGSFTHLAVVASSLLFEVRLRTARQMFVALASVVWMTRLGTFLYNRILRDGVDTRFDQFKPVRLAFLQAWSIQAVWVTLIELPVILINDRDDVAPTTVLDYVAMIAWIVGFLIEAAADTQKMVFRNDTANRHKYITSGFWRYSRHPNYFGEILMWSAIAYLTSAAGHAMAAPELHAAWISPAFTAVLLLGATGVPMVEKAGLEKWGTDAAYMQYMKGTSCVVPWFPAGSAAAKAD